MRKGYRESLYQLLLSSPEDRLHFHEQGIKYLYSKYKSKSKNSQLVSVFGAFETWPYMGYICRLVAERGHVAISSRFVYPPGEAPEKLEHEKMLPMREFLQALTTSCNKAIVIFSVSAAHFVETEWLYCRCLEETDKENALKVLGIAFVRQINPTKPKERNCKHNQITGVYSICTGERNAWKCMEEKGFCPFIRQDISKNIIEYFCKSKKLMTLTAIENIEEVPNVLGTIGI